MAGRGAASRIVETETPIAYVQMDGLVIIILLKTG